MQEVITNLLGDIVWLLLGILGYQLLNLFRTIIPTRVVWKLDEPKNVVICASNSVTSDTGEYKRPATGIGQVRALALVVTSLNKAYGKIDFKNVFLSTDQLHEYLENDLILLGGTKNNELTARYLQLLESTQPVILKGSTIQWRKRVEKNFVDYDIDEFHGETKDDNVVTDFGLAMRTQSPFTDKPRSVVLIAGSHTYGTSAAAKFFTENLYKAYPKEVRKRNIVLLISTQIINGYPTSMKVEKHYEW